MIFVVKPTVNRSWEETVKLQEKLYKDLNAACDQVLVLPTDCTYDIINDYNRRNVVVVRDSRTEVNKI